MTHGAAARIDRAHPPDEFAWCPDWTGQTAVIVASGPSATEPRLDVAQGKARFVAINESWKLAPWADVLYACDWHWVTKRNKVGQFQGLRVTQDKHVAGNTDGPRWHKVHTVGGCDKLLFDPPGYICWGGNSGMQALNLAAQWGAAKILLVGFDMGIHAGAHWHGRHIGGLNNPTEPNTARWRKAMDDAYGQFTERGITVINCSQNSALQRYPKMPFEDALHA